MTRKDYIQLYDKYISGDCTPEEIKMLETYKDDFSLDDEGDKDTSEEHRVIIDRIHDKLIKNIKSQRIRKVLWYRLPIAAAVTLFVLSFGLFFYFQKTDIITAPQTSDMTTIPPGGNKAVLTLDDGSQIILDQSGNGILANQGRAVIHKEENGKLVYNAAGVKTAGQKIKYNTITIPRGGQYRLVLPDGTNVWLNAESSLRFPVAFTGSDRKVELSGEGYFEVTSDKRKPFSVLTKGTEVQVLGTRFNVNSYSEDVSTTLLEGSVKLTSAGSSVLLKPGQSGTKLNGQFEVESADMESAVAWKNGFFVFHDESIESIMEKVGRWYDVKVEYRGNVKNKTFYGKVSRYKNVDELLKNMELTGTVRFRIEPGPASGKERRIIVMP